ARKIVELRELGLPATSNNAADIIEFLDAFVSLNRDILPCEKTTNFIGWQGKDGFLIGEEPHGNCDVAFFSDNKGEMQFVDSFGKKGTFEEWKNVIEKVRHFPAIMGALYAALGTPLLKILNINGFTYELAGRTSRGKTTGLRIAVSVWGNPNENSSEGDDDKTQDSLIHSWSGTRVFFERTASLLNGIPLFVDDTKTCKNPQTLADILYMIGNGRAKGRGNITGIDQTKSIRTILLSTAETPSILATHDGGTRGRLLEVTVDPFTPKKGDEIFAIIDGREVDDLNFAVQDNYGWAGPVFVDYILANEKNWPDWQREWREIQGQFAYSASNDGGSEVSGRLAKYAALITITGRLAHEALGFEWDYNDPMMHLWPIVTAESADPTGEQDCLDIGKEIHHAVCH
ncbi:MAG: DUF927 domain-containing protein, partial [Clostridiales bacterium]|nr:DUF927 domain-containing protein [Clostridiales bacterium]